MIENNSMSFFFQFFFMQQKVGQIQYLPFRSEFRRILVYSHNERSSIYIQEHRHHRSYKERFHMEARNKVSISWIIQFVLKKPQRVFYHQTYGEILPTDCSDGRKHLHGTFQFLCTCLWPITHTDKLLWSRDTLPCWTNDTLALEDKENRSPTDLSPWMMKVSLPISNGRHRALCNRKKDRLLDIDRERCFVWQTTILTKKEKTTGVAEAAWQWPMNSHHGNELLYDTADFTFKIKNRSFIIACQ